MFSKRLKYIRKLRKLSQEELAKKINTTKSTISNYENEYSTPSNDVLRDLSNALNTTTDYLLGRTDNPEPFNNKDEFNPMDEINQLLKKYDIDQSGFFDIEKWKSMGPDEIRELESYFEYITSKAKKKNEESSN